MSKPFPSTNNEKNNYQRFQSKFMPITIATTDPKNLEGGQYGIKKL